jgi:hypothetical protein
MPALVFVKAPVTVKDPPNPDWMVPELVTLAKVTFGSPALLSPMESVGVDPDAPTVSPLALIVSLLIVTVYVPGAVMQAFVVAVGGALSLQFDPSSHAPPELLVQVSQDAAAAGGADAIIVPTTMPIDELTRTKVASARAIDTRGVRRPAASALIPDMVASLSSEAAVPPAKHTSANATQRARVLARTLHVMQTLSHC